MSQMNIAVLIKQVPDTGMNLQIQEGQINESLLKWVLCPYDEFALEEALKFKEKFQGRVYALSLGPARAKEALMTALALGADEALHLVIDKMPQDPLAIAQALKNKISEIPQLSLIFCGKLSSDLNNFAVPQMLAGLLNWPFVTNVNKLKYEEGLFFLNRECGGGVEEILKAKAPLLISADKGLNKPRYPSLPGIMKAKKKPFKSHPTDLAVEEKIQLKKLDLPPKKQEPYMMEGDSEKQVAQLVQILREKEKVI